MARLRLGQLRLYGRDVLFVVAVMRSNHSIFRTLAFAPSHSRIIMPSL